ncbi:MAG: 9-O-acetylesterase [Planctomycetaceae bacterium]|nr:9-O-acetylesterase [Planctomycetaceae bacterium]
MKKSCFLLLFIFVAAMLSAGFVSADVKLPEIFSTNMVLQQELPVPVWGTAAADEKITVSFAGQTETATAGNDGKWSLTLKPLKANAEPQTFTVKGNNEIKLENVLVGEVWLCSGQSNMEWTMTRSAEYNDELPKVENKNIRLFQVSKAWNQEPQDTLANNPTWQPCNAETIPGFSAVGYFFGKKLNAELKVPIGLINSSWGGTRIEPWTPPCGFNAVKTLSNIAEDVAARDPKTDFHKKLVTNMLGEYKNWLETAEKGLAGAKMQVPPPAYPQQLAPYANHQQPTVLYNAMVKAFVPFAMRGAIWYQGESNMSEGLLYAEKMKALILGWRDVFKNPDFGFYYVQLAPYIYGGGDPTRLAYLWEAQAKVEKELPKTGMAVINDTVSDIRDIHPPRKSPVGQRLALLALNRTYSKKNIVCASPEFDKMEVNGATAVLSFKEAKELKTRDGKAPDWFEIAGIDGVYHKATAEIAGTTIKLTSPAVQKPVAIRFAWHHEAEPNVQNEAGLQLGAFRAGEIPVRSVFDSLVPEGKNFKLLYSFDPTQPQLSDDKTQIVYKTDNTREIVGKIKKVGYFLYLKPKDGKEQFVFVTMPPLSDKLEQLGVPVKSTGARFQKQIKDVAVYSNVEGVATGKFADGFNVEFWDCNYGPLNQAQVPGASAVKWDFGDEMSGQSPGYGSMQIHNFAKKQTVFAFNNFAAGNNADVGIGNNPDANGNPDWTFSKNAQKQSGGQLMIFVEPE